MAGRLPQTRYAQSTGAKIAYQVSGTGPPDLVMVPGLVSHLDIQWQQTGYRRFVRALERGARLIRLDKRGTGLSDPSGDLPTTGERVQDVAAVMAAAKSSRAVLFGLSDGGRAAIAFAAAHPHRTQGLINTEQTLGSYRPMLLFAAAFPRKKCSMGESGTTKVAPIATGNAIFR